MGRRVNLGGDDLSPDFEALTRKRAEYCFKSTVSEKRTH